MRENEGRNIEQENRKVEKGMGEGRCRGITRANDKPSRDKQNKKRTKRERTADSASHLSAAGRRDSLKLSPPFVFHPLSCPTPFDHISCGHCASSHLSNLPLKDRDTSSFCSTRFLTGLLYPYVWHSVRAHHPTPSSPSAFEKHFAVVQSSRPAPPCNDSLHPYLGLGTEPSKQKETAK